jgi:hypothetical protein
MLGCSGTMRHHAGLAGLRLSDQQDTLVPVDVGHIQPDRLADEHPVAASSPNSVWPRLGDRPQREADLSVDRGGRQIPVPQYLADLGQRDSLGQQLGRQRVTQPM